MLPPPLIGTVTSSQSDIHKPCRYSLPVGQSDIHKPCRYSLPSSQSDIHKSYKYSLPVLYVQSAQVASLQIHKLSTTVAVFSGSIGCQYDISFGLVLFLQNFHLFGHIIIPSHILLSNTFPTFIFPNWFFLTSFLIYDAQVWIRCVDVSVLHSAGGTRCILPLAI